VKPPSFRCFAARPIEETLSFGRSTGRPKGCSWADRGVRRASRILCHLRTARDADLGG
jgi:hypothetical protein